MACARAPASRQAPATVGPSGLGGTGATTTAQPLLDARAASPLRPGPRPRRRLQRPAGRGSRPVWRRVPAPRAVRAASHARRRLDAAAQVQAEPGAVPSQRHHGRVRVVLAALAGAAPATGRPRAQVGLRRGQHAHAVGRRRAPGATGRVRSSPMRRLPDARRCSHRHDRAGPAAPPCCDGARRPGAALRPARRSQSRAQAASGRSADPRRRPASGVDPVGPGWARRIARRAGAGARLPDRSAVDGLRTVDAVGAGAVRSGSSPSWKRSTPPG
ncbi:MAG: hypothetical protein KatS3mg043_1121 [Rhodothermaceae bacterium]|nr:MAG: hypothetical protein KatS3mg043_1121 [Rhodothermaceae bacterium]